MGKFFNKTGFIINNTILKIKGQYISWQTVVSLYEQHRLEGCGLTILPKLTAEHITLNSYSRMKVKLAVQVNISLIV